MTQSLKFYLFILIHETRIFRRRSKLHAAYTPTSTTHIDRITPRENRGSKKPVHIGNLPEVCLFDQTPQPNLSSAFVCADISSLTEAPHLEKISP